jgi:transglutaminase-like putative cysteine protease
MRFQVHSDMQYSVRLQTTFIFNIHALRTSGQTVLEETLVIDPYNRLEEFTATSSPNRFIRLEVPQGTNFKISYKAIVDTNFKEVDFQGTTDASPVSHLDGDIIPFLFPSRYCQSDKLQRLAFNKFGKIENTYMKVLTISEWIYDNVEYLSGSTDSHTSAHDTISERAGVCRDFAHLGIALCRALSIPARYFTGYSYQLNPPDFHACFEAYIGGHWIIFDPTKLAPLNGLVKIASGRDAADAAIASTFGNAICNSIQVGCDLIDENFQPFMNDKSNFKCLAY